MSELTERLIRLRDRPTGQAFSYAQTATPSLMP